MCCSISFSGPSSVDKHTLDTCAIIEKGYSREEFPYSRGAPVQQAEDVYFELGAPATSVESSRLVTIFSGAPKRLPQRGALAGGLGNATSFVSGPLALSVGGLGFPLSPRFLSLSLSLPQKQPEHLSEPPLGTPAAPLPVGITSSSRRRRRVTFSLCCCNGGSSDRAAKRGSGRICGKLGEQPTGFLWDADGKGLVEASSA